MSLPQYSPPADSSTPSPPARLTVMRSAVHGLLNSISRDGPRAHTPESPKTPPLPLGLPEIPATHLVIPLLPQTHAPNSNSSTPISPISSHGDSTSSSPASVRPITPNSFREIQRAGSESRDSSRRFVGVDTVVQELPNQAESGRRRRSSGNKTNRRCFPNRSKRVRAKIMSCLISGSVLVVMLTLCMYPTSSAVFYAVHSHSHTPRTNTPQFSHSPSPRISNLRNSGSFYSS